MSIYICLRHNSEHFSKRIIHVEHARQKLQSIFFSAAERSIASTMFILYYILKVFAI